MKPKSDYQKDHVKTPTVGFFPFVTIGQELNGGFCAIKSIHYERMTGNELLKIQRELAQLITDITEDYLKAQIQPEEK